MLYFHIPFCKQKCYYCNFHFSTSLNLIERFIEALHKEIDLRHQELIEKNIRTIYFGGGTPSIIGISHIKNIINKCNSYYNFNPDIEITLEANPDDITQNFLKELSNSGVNRLSIGIQSFFDEDLKFMNRSHTATQAEDSIKKSQDIGFENINIDLIYGVSPIDIWKKNLQKTVQLNVPHISSYALTIEPKTVFEKWIKEKQIKSPNEELQNNEFYYMVDFLKENDFLHYEISNFSKKGLHSKHNSAYWKGKAYIGFGPSAHSFDGKNKRSWNIANNSLYIKGIFENNRNFESEILSYKEKFNELLMIGLRTMWGANLNKINAYFCGDVLNKFYFNLQKKKKEGLIVEEKGYIKIPEKYWFWADGIASDLFLV